jgi:hypothetical protein
MLCHREDDDRDDSLPMNNTGSFDHSVQGNTTVLIDLMLSEAEKNLKPVRWHSLRLPPRNQASFVRSATAVPGLSNGQEISRLNSDEAIYSGWRIPVTASDLELGRSDGTRSNDISHLSSHSRMSGSTNSSGGSTLGSHGSRNSENSEHTRTRSNGSVSSASSSESSGVSTNSELSSFGGSDTSSDDLPSLSPKHAQDPSFLLKLKQTVSTAAFSHVNSSRS